MMLAGGPDKSALPRDTIFSSIRIICNGAAGLCVLLGGLKPITGIVIALLVLLPETGAAVRAARADRSRPASTSRSARPWRAPA